jgi:hypothetical protein
VGLLVFATTLSNVWHHHDSNSENACPICHLNHQPIERPLAGHRLPVLVPVSAHADAFRPSIAPTSDFRRVPARAPPSA